MFYLAQQSMIRGKEPSLVRNLLIPMKYFFCLDFRNGECILLARKLTKYLAATDFIDNHGEIFTSSQKYLPRGACEWILTHPEFVTWKNSPTSNFIALTGGRGTGKFVLASLITNSLINDPIEKNNVVYFLGVLWVKEPLTPSLILRCLISQLLCMRPDVLMRKKATYLFIYLSYTD